MTKPNSSSNNQFMLVLILLCTSCEDVMEGKIEELFEINGNFFYQNSFESSRDTIQWQGYGSFELRTEAPDNGGKQSAFIAGGCIVPHAYLDFGPMKEAGAYILSCWGKNLSNGGFITLESVGDYMNSIYIQVINEDWKKYVAVDTLVLPAGEKIRLSMNAGGLVGSSMLVDVLEIVKVNSQ